MISSTYFITILKVFNPSCVRKPSAMVLGLIDGIIFPSLNDLYASSAFFGSTAITFALGNNPLVAIAVPLRKPPPPTGAKT